MPLSNAPHRQSFSESLRGLPPSPRAQRQPSLTQLAVQELIDNPPARNQPDPAFLGRDWRKIPIVELVSLEELKFVDVEAGVEAATNVGLLRLKSRCLLLTRHGQLLIESGANVLLIRDNPNSRFAIGTFGYNDLNAYLLTVIGVARADEDHIKDFRELARKAKEGEAIPDPGRYQFGPEGAFDSTPAHRRPVKGRGNVWHWDTPYFRGTGRHKRNRRRSEPDEVGQILMGKWPEFPRD